MGEKSLRGVLSPSVDLSAAVPSFCFWCPVRGFRLGGTAVGILEAGWEKLWLTTSTEEVPRLFGVGGLEEYAREDEEAFAEETVVDRAVGWAFWFEIIFLCVTFILLTDLRDVTGGDVAAVAGDKVGVRREGLRIGFSVGVGVVLNAEGEALKFCSRGEEPFVRLEVDDCGKLRLLLVDGVLVMNTGEIGCVILSIVSLSEGRSWVSTWARSSTWVSLLLCFDSDRGRSDLEAEGPELLRL
jgi:hypothetical protein